MTLPSDTELRSALLLLLESSLAPLGAKDAYAALGRSLALTDEDLALALPSGHNRFQNRVRWMRQKLVRDGLIDSSVRGR